MEKLHLCSFVSLKGGQVLANLPEILSNKSAARMMGKDCLIHLFALQRSNSGFVHMISTQREIKKL